MRISDWSSDVCSSDLPARPGRIADAILDAFGDSFRFDKEEFTITASIGIAQSPQDGVAVQALVQNADAAMYDSKRRIRNGWQPYTPALEIGRASCRERGCPYW